ncbi:MAG: DUF5683 domain-containing protein [Candidatus Cloacimonadota bacterium]
MKKLIISILLLVTLASLAGIEISRPYRAGAYSLVLPGGGQIYNKAYVKTGIVIGVQGYLIGTALYHNSKKKDFQTQADNAATPFDQQYYQIQADDYSDRLRSDYWWMGITTALSVIDAWIDAHLVDFEAESQRIHLHFEDGQVGLQIKF